MLLAREEQRCPGHSLHPESREGLSQGPLLSSCTPLSRSRKAGSTAEPLRHEKNLMPTNPEACWGAQALGEGAQGAAGMRPILPRLGLQSPLSMSQPHPGQAGWEAVGGQGGQSHDPYSGWAWLPPLTCLEKGRQQSVPGWGALPLSQGPWKHLPLFRSALPPKLSGTQRERDLQEDSPTETRWGFPQVPPLPMLPGVGQFY